MPSRRQFISLAPAILGAMTILPKIAKAQSSAELGGAQAINASVFYGEHIKAVTAVTEVFGRSQRTTAAIIEYDQVIQHDNISKTQWSVAGRTILKAYASNDAKKATNSSNGVFIILELDPNDEGAETYAPKVETPATVMVSQVKPLQTLSGTIYPPTDKAIINTRQVNLIVDDFLQFRYIDPLTGLLLNYNLYIPKNYDKAKSYPLVLFMHDAGVTGTNPLRTLQQGLGAISFASPSDQEANPAFVLAPQYPTAIANDASQTSDYADVTIRLINSLLDNYSIDSTRLYTTGQSGGCMTSIALNIKYPDLFAASFLVAGQWDPAQVAPLAKHKIWIIVSQDDDKAYPGMNAITDKLEQNGAKITRAIWDGQSSPSEFQAAQEKMINEGPDSNIYYVAFRAGTVIPVGESGLGGGHVWTWPIAYAIPSVRRWLLSQQKT
ncbi:hypothetical protein N5853_10685 [Bartonella sp. HY329]|uniref:hypothetical protein n=1 Tax=unclassified Bartonella TaxID=2645622 RepID=UPI0021C68E20|nr:MULTISPECIES: hypothetical protein [unclassified Bartonella]UXM94563.1 hypothetical protein N5853_10685 [Bartonella sp. HY329]UXN08887.1 hypothetical protein N5852_10695 [Bartonella sp. HY328]